MTNEVIDQAVRLALVSQLRQLGLQALNRGLLPFLDDQLRDERRGHFFSSAGSPLQPELAQELIPQTELLDLARGHRPLGHHAYVAGYLEAGDLALAEVDE